MSLECKFPDPAKAGILYPGLCVVQTFWLSFFFFSPGSFVAEVGLPRAGMTSVHPHDWYLWCWGKILGLRVC